MTRTIKSFSDPRKAYFMHINDETGEADDCQCPDCQIRRRQCKHQRDFNTEFAKALKFNEMMAQFDVRSEAVKAQKREAFVQQFGIYA